jgi:hypothetical protein
VWPLTSKNEVQMEDALLASLQTNEEMPDFDIIREFAQKIVSAEGPELKDIVKQYMDVNEVISYAVVDRIIRHDDGPFFWYCIGDRINHNYYWYEEPTNKKIQLIPWDLDNAFVQLFRDVENKPIVPDKWGQITNNCKPYKYKDFGLMLRSASCGKLTFGWVLFDKEYIELKKHFQEDIMIHAQEKLNLWSAQIVEAIIQASLTHYDAVKQNATTLEEWKEAVKILRSKIRFMRFSQ